MAEVLFIIYGLKQLVDLGAHLPRGFFSGADPGFPKGGGVNPLIWSKNLFWARFFRKLHEIEKMDREPRGGTPPWLPFGFLWIPNFMGLSENWQSFEFPYVGHYETATGFIIPISPSFSLLSSYISVYLSVCLSVFPFIPPPSLCTCEMALALSICWSSPHIMSCWGLYLRGDAGSECHPCCDLPVFKIDILIPK